MTNIDYTVFRKILVRSEIDRLADLLAIVDHVRPDGIPGSHASAARERADELHSQIYDLSCRIDPTWGY